MDKKNEVLQVSKEELIENYRKAYDKAKEAAVAAAQVSFPPLLEMEALWKEQRKGN